MSDLWICCAVLKEEISYLFRQKLIEGNLLFLDSMLHMNPMMLNEKVEKAILQNKLNYDHIYLVYGDCCPGMIDLQEKYNIKRVTACNCIQLLVGKEEYRKYMKNETFVLLPEWTSRWKEIFQKELGLNANTAKEFMNDTRRNLLYIDTGMFDIPLAMIKDCSDYLGLTYQILSVNLDTLLQNMLQLRQI